MIKNKIMIINKINNILKRNKLKIKFIHRQIKNKNKNKRWNINKQYNTNKTKIINKTNNKNSKRMM